MTHEREGCEEPQSLSDEEARRLLARASEIDSAQAALPVADLRQASLEAGIAPEAFEQALIELRGSHAVAEPRSEMIAATFRKRWRVALLSTMKTVGIVLATLFVLMMLVDLIG